jgi:repressor LexA
LNGLTKRQVEVLSFVRQFIDKHEFSPSLHDIKDHFGFASANAAAKHLAMLKRKGHLFAKANSHRSISLPNKPKRDPAGITLPLIGQIKAGKPIDLFAEIQFMHVSYIESSWPKEIYLLKVQDNSLQDEMLLENDLLIVETRLTPSQGETVVAIVNQYNTFVARYFCDGEYVKLMSHTTNHQPIILHVKDLAIQGIVIASLRNY